MLSRGGDWGRESIVKGREKIVKVEEIRSREPGERQG